MAFAALLQNPQLERFVMGDPFRKGTCGDFPSVGAFLAEGAHRVAGDYVRRAAELLDRDYPRNCVDYPDETAKDAAASLVRAQGV